MFNAVGFFFHLLFSGFYCHVNTMGFFYYSIIIISSLLF